MIPLPKPAKVVEKKGNRGVFEIEALYPGYGVTVGNALRRILLSSLQGAAITQVKMVGAAHEFATIEGMHEDVLAVMLNLKKLRFRVFSDEPQTATLKVRGEKEVTGADFKLSAQVELMNEDLVIAHLTSKSAELELEVQIEKGMGYVPADVRKKEKEGIGVVALDAVFSPIQKVSFSVDNMRVGDRTDFAKLTFEIETDGTLDPEAALKKSVMILVDQYNAIMEGLKEEEVKTEVDAGEEKKTEKKTTKKPTAKKATKKATASKKKVAKKK